jgi:hypothetical protein
MHLTKLAGSEGGGDPVLMLSDALSSPTTQLPAATNHKDRPKSLSLSLVFCMTSKIGLPSQCPLLHANAVRCMTDLWWESWVHHGCITKENTQKDTCGPRRTAHGMLYHGCIIKENICKVRWIPQMPAHGIVQGMLTGTEVCGDGGRAASPCFNAFHDWIQSTNNREPGVFASALRSFERFGF